MISFRAFADELRKLAMRLPLPQQPSKVKSPVAASYEVQPTMQGQEAINAMNANGSGNDSAPRG